MYVDVLVGRLHFKDMMNTHSSMIFKAILLPEGTMHAMGATITLKLSPIQKTR